MDEKWMNNSVELCGELGGRPAFSHISRGEAYYVFPLQVRRLSGAFDTINILARESLLEAVAIRTLPKLSVQGELRSFNNKTGQGSRLVITVFARALDLTDGPYCNSVLLQGTLCKAPNLRQTPMGREICDLMLAVSRRYGRSDYLPCICWGQNAVEAGRWRVGEVVALDGRIQSRAYIKMEDGRSIKKTAFEVSVTSQQKV